MTDEERQAFLQELGISLDVSATPEATSAELTDEDRLAFLNSLDQGQPIPPTQLEGTTEQPYSLEIPSRFGFFGSIPESQFASGERNIAGNVFERPSAALRAGLQALPPGGENPVAAYQRAAVNPTGVPTFQDQALDAYYRSRLAQALPPPVRFAVGNIPSAVGLAADVGTNPADVLAGLTTGGISKAVAPTKLGRAIGEFATKPRHLRHRLETVQEVMQVPEAKLPRLTVRERSAYFQERSNQLRQQFKTRDITLRGERVALQRELGKVAQKRSLFIRSRLPELYTKQSKHYRALVDKELAPLANEVVPDTELRTFLTQRFSKDPERLNAVSMRLGISNEPIPQPSLFPELEQVPSRSIGQIYQQVLDFGQTLPRPVRESLRVYSAADDLTDDSISSLVEFLDTKGVHLQEARAFWKSWAPIRNQATREFRPFLDPDVATRAGSLRLSRLAQGIDPDNEVYAKTLTELLEIDSLPGELKLVVSKLDANQKAKLAIALQQQEASGTLQALKFRVNQIADREARKWEKAKVVLGWLSAAGGLGYLGSTIRRSLP